MDLTVLGGDFFYQRKDLSISKSDILLKLCSLAYSLAGKKEGKKLKQPQTKN